MKVLVTGGAGYIGSVVSAHLIDRGHDVVVLDDLRNGHREAVPAGAAFMRATLRDAPSLLQALICFGAPVDAVVHMAASSLVGESVMHPEGCYENNVVAGLALLDAMVATGVRNLVFSSTAAVYGRPEKDGPIEETDALLPTNPYAASKLAFEEALRWYGDAHGIRSASLRYFNAAGADGQRGDRHDPATHLIPLVLDAALGRRREIVVYGDDYPTPDGTCIRDYVHVADLADAHARALDALLLQTSNHGSAAGYAGGAGVGEQRLVYNLGCGSRGSSVKDVIDSVERVSGRDVPVRIGPRRPGDPARLVASSSRIRAALGWSPQRASLDAIVASAFAFAMTREPVAHNPQVIAP